MGVSFLELLVAVGVTFGSAIIQGSIGFGFNIISVPLLALIDPRLAPVPQLVVALPLTVAVMLRERTSIDMKGVGWIIAGRFPGAAIGLGLLLLATRRTVDLLLASFVLLAVFVLARGLRVRRSPVIDFSAGVASGVSGLVASMGGPPLALLFSGERGPTFRSTLGALFTIGVILSLTTRVLGGQITREELLVGLVLIAPAGGGFLISSRLLKRVEGNVLRAGVFVLSTIAATTLLVRAVIG